MKKYKKYIKKENIVYFPGLPERLLSMGIEQLDLKNFEAALSFLLQAREMDEESPEIQAALLVALFETGNYTEAKILCEQMLKTGIGDYFETIDIYLLVLIHLKEYNKAAETINALLEEKEVPFHKLEHYEKLMEFSERRSDIGMNNFTISNENKLDLTSMPLQEQIFATAELMNTNIQPYIDDFIQILNDSNQHPFLQTMILNLLKEHGNEKKIKIQKFHYSDMVIPAELPPLFETPFYKELNEQLQIKIEQENPSLYEQIKTIMDKHFFLLYPFELDPEEVTLWAASYQTLGQELYGEQIDNQKIREVYEIKETAFKKSLEFLHKLEEISLPIL
ncbi:tetratricopeptide repeat protein [Bacillus sp. FJAT-49736]|uniref:tetratricopeptide repeat protein n=1 Tax=Bacillus sp. FJAT-49736 TaxID=2833582 RepID=UPI001BC8F430|nr:tetratricopeptide repeat protein [Bacillus sp. FJAT-49736]MBS4173736.1 tetratricopeptide repeat protein [Bacillus sp. FJAT-49736]